MTAEFEDDFYLVGFAYWLALCALLNGVDDAAEHAAVEACAESETEPMCVGAEFGGVCYGFVHGGIDKHAVH